MGGGGGANKTITTKLSKSEMVREWTDGENGQGMDGW